MKLKLSAYATWNMRNSKAIFTFLFFVKKYPFWANKQQEMGLTGEIKKKKKEKFKKKFYSKKIFKLIKKIQNFLTFQRLIHKINLNALGSLKNKKKWLNSYFFCAK